MRGPFVILAIALIGCTSIGTHQRTTDVRPGPAKMPGDERTSKPSVGGVTGISGASRKRVKAKEAPATLVADDNSRCTVTDQRFKDTSVGDYEDCNWTG